LIIGTMLIDKSGKYLGVWGLRIAALFNEAAD
jgi:hypothetical protein